MRDRLARPSIRAAIVLVACAVGTMLAWRVTDADWLDAWMPNIVTGLVTVAATITVVEEIIQREARMRIAPWRNRVIDDLRFAVLSFGWGVTIAYAPTHLRP